LGIVSFKTDFSYCDFKTENPETGTGDHEGFSLLSVPVNCRNLENTFSFSMF
jgi:hypothetical protein